MSLFSFLVSKVQKLENLEMAFHAHAPQKVAQASINITASAYFTLGVIVEGGTHLR